MTKQHILQEIKRIASGNGRAMDYRNKIQVELIKLISGERLMRLTYSPTGLVLEAILDSRHALHRQKERLFSIFEAALLKDELTPA